MDAWTYRNGFSYNISFEAVREKFKLNYPDIDVSNFEYLNEIRFEIFEIVIGEEYAADPEKFIKPEDIGKKLYFDIPESLKPEFDKR